MEEEYESKVFEEIENRKDALDSNRVIDLQRVQDESFVDVPNNENKANKDKSKMPLIKAYTPGGRAKDFALQNKLAANPNPDQTEFSLNSQQETPIDKQGQFTYNIIQSGEKPISTNRMQPTLQGYNNSPSRLNTNKYYTPKATISNQHSQFTPSHTIKASQKSVEFDQNYL